MSNSPPPQTTTAEPRPVASRSRADGRATIRRIIIAFLTAAVLSTDQLVATAEQMPYGQSRSAVLAASSVLDRAAAGLSLDRPSSAIESALGRDPEPAGSQFATVVATQEPGSSAGSDPPETTPDRRPGNGGPTGAATTSGSGGRTASRSSTDGPPVTHSSLDGTPQRTPAAEVDPVAPVRSISPEDKLRLWAGGDSLGEYVGNQLLHPLSDSELTEVELDYRISTGLARPDYFDWLGQIQAVMGEGQPPDAVIFMVGGNDDQNMLAQSEVVELGSDAWLAEYRRRVAAFMDTTNTGSSLLYWIGLPPMRDDERQSISSEINAILTTEAAKRPWVTFIDLGPQFSGPDGGYQAQITDSDGNQRVARAPDGVHITFAGSTWVADDIWATIVDRWDLTNPAAPPLAPLAVEISEPGLLPG